MAHATLNIFETPDIPAVVAVNVAIRCRHCGDVIHGNPFWSIRKSAQLHVNGSCGAPRGWELDPLLESLARREPFQPTQWIGYQ